MNTGDGQQLGLSFLHPPPKDALELELFMQILRLKLLSVLFQ